MEIDASTLVAILLMALATYATRAAGLWAASRFELSEGMEAWLERVPGAILVSLSAPAVFGAGVPGLLAAAAVLVVARKTGSLVLAMATGVVAVLVLRNLA
ncbi:MAG: AzlD domain-containing protein [Actinomycetota bacterium]